jgi:DNA-binding response OmpR family regulator
LSLAPGAEHFTAPERQNTIGEYLGHQQRGASEILLVEDHEATAEMVILLLRDEGYDVHWVSTAGEAVKVFSNLPTDNHDRCPDLMLLDLSLPDMDPIEMVESIMTTHKSLPPIIVVSAKPRDIIDQTARSLGARAVLRKPFEIDALLQAVERVLAQPVSSN